jgi:NADH dehydrogenase FAD-containing subunit
MMTGLHKPLQLLAVRTSISKAVNRYASFGSSGKPKVVVVGAGWAGYRVAHDLDKQKYDVAVVSPRNHFLFTPLLPSTTVGTLEFRAIQEPVRTIPKIHYFQADVQSVDFENGKILCQDAFKRDQHQFNLPYDALVVAAGSETNTFGIHGVENNEDVYFLKQLKDSRAIRNRLIGITS